MHVDEMSYGFLKQAADLRSVVRSKQASKSTVCMLRRVMASLSMLQIFLICFLFVLQLLLRCVTALQFSAAGFKIAPFADLHFGEAAWEEWGPAQDRNSTRVMSHVLGAENPDLVIFLGDILTANNMPSPNATNYWDQALSATLERNIPWASLFGNHDDMAFEWPLEWFGNGGVPGENEIDEYFRGTTRAQLMKNEIAHAQSLSMDGNKTLWPSVSNYALQIESSQDSASPVVILYVLDSGGGSYPELISERQAAWFNAVANELNPQQSIPELAFWHIPSQAYAKMAPHPGSPIQSPCVGSINLEPVAAQAQELGFMEIISTRSSMKASFVGHNHGLDWCCPYRSMHLCFARHTGYGGYGNWTRGARILELVERPFGLNTYIRLENGTISSRVKLV